MKLGATGDVVRTTTLLNILEGEIHWLTSDNNAILLNSIPKIDRCVPWGDINNLRNEIYDLIINLEDSLEVARLLNEMKYKELFGAYLDNADKLTYTESSKEWFDISLISKFGKKKADELKLKNRKTYQEMIFKGLGYTFSGEKYFLPKPIRSNILGDIAIALECGSVWAMKNWAFYSELKQKLEEYGFTVNFLPIRESILEHIGDIQNHHYVISGDSLPMHIALGSGIKCLTIFICTSPWEIFDYGIQKKVVSPYLEKYFYKRGFDLRATTSISITKVYKDVLQHIGRAWSEIHHVGLT
ncbi:MAG: glycosyltransferase family 9 protein [Promethearchaeota archaeon]